MPVLPALDGQPGRSPYDVIVVGAGAAGAATAMLLARSSLRVLLLDRGPGRAEPFPVRALMRAGVLLLARWRVLDSVAAAGTPPLRRSTFRHGQEQTVITVTPSHGVDALYAPRRELLDGALVAAAADAGADMAGGTTVDGLLRQGQRVVGVQMATVDGRRVDVRATLVIGADGAASTVARAAGATPTRVGRHARAMTYGCWAGLDTDGYEWTFDSNVCSAILPTNDGLACVLAAATPERIGAGGAATTTELAGTSSPETGERLRRAAATGTAGTWTARVGHVRRSHGAGWALVGEAGCFTDPIGAHGATGALRDAELLARAVVDGFGTDATLAAALEQFETTRNELALPIFDVVDRIASHQWDDGEIAERLLQLSSARATEVETLAALEPEVAS
jgi:2-polyprenyl-6-methoxyphenol hydroxylase-like FAD-dependent oxidoreductase